MGPNGQQVKMYQNPKTGCWMEQSVPTSSQISASAPISQLQTQNITGTSKISKSQIQKPIIKQPPSMNTTKCIDARGRGQFFLRGDSLTESNKFHNIAPPRAGLILF